MNSNLYRNKVIAVRIVIWFPVSDAKLQNTRTAIPSLFNQKQRSVKEKSR